MTSEDTDQPAHSRSLIRVFAGFWGIQGSNASSGRQQRLISSAGNRRGKSQSIIGKVKRIDYRLYNWISKNWHQIINHYSICTLCFYII